MQSWSSVLSQNWTLTKYKEDSSSCPRLLYMALFKKPITFQCRINVQWPVCCFLSKASKFLDSFSERPSMKSFDSLIPGMAAQYSECILVSHFLILTLPTHGEMGATGFRPRKGLLDPFLVRASAITDLI
jgi:hypothetical protein